VTALLVTAPASADNKDRDRDRGNDLEIYKTAEAHFKRGDCKFDVDKKVNGYDYVKIYSKDDTERVKYTVDVDKKCYDSDFVVKGKIVVKNPNRRDAKRVYVKDNLDHANCKVFGYGDRIRGYETKEFYYKCDVYGAHEGDRGENEACVYWDKDSIKSRHDYACDTADFKFDRPDNDNHGDRRDNDCTRVFDKFDYDYEKFLGKVCDTNDYRPEFEYYRELDVPRYGCKEFENKVREDKSYSDDSAKVTLCRKDDHH